MNSRQIFATLAVAVLLVAAILTAACNESQLRAGARATSEGARQFRAELDDEHASGDISDAQVSEIAPFADEIERGATEFGEKCKGYDHMTPAERRALVAGGVQTFAGVLQRLDESGALHVKSEKAEKRLREALKDVRRGVAVLQVVEAALPPESGK